MSLFDDPEPPAPKIADLAPYIVLISAMLVIAVAIAIYLKRRKRDNEQRVNPHNS